MTNITTKTGFKAKIDESTLDDYRLMKAIREAQAMPVKIVDVVAFVLGKDEDRLVEHVVKTTGKASMSAIEAEMTDIFAQLSESKKK